MKGCNFYKITAFFCANIQMKLLVFFLIFQYPCNIIKLHKGLGI